MKRYFIFAVVTAAACQVGAEEPKPADGDRAGPTPGATPRPNPKPDEPVLVPAGKKMTPDGRVVPIPATPNPGKSSSDPKDTSDPAKPQR